MEQADHNHNGILMRGMGRLFVYSRPRAWLGMTFEVPRLLRGITLPSGARCLDIATGLGWASAGLARRDPSLRIVALDYDATILPRTRAYLDTHDAGGRATLCRGDAKRLPFHDGAFDLVICLYGLHHVRGYSQSLADIARVLKPGGTFALVDPIRRAGKPPGGHHGTEVLTGDELSQMLKDAGFEIVRARVAWGTAREVMHKRPPVQPAA